MENHTLIAANKKGGGAAPWYLTRRAVIIGFILLGPMALPLLWFSPKFSFAAKCGLTVLSVALTLLFFKYSMALFELVMRRVEELGSLGY